MAAYDRPEPVADAASADRRVTDPKQSTALQGSGHLLHDVCTLPDVKGPPLLSGSRDDQRGTPFDSKCRAIAFNSISNLRAYAIGRRSSAVHRKRIWFWCIKGIT